jgi:FHA domain-containing protein
MRCGLKFLAPAPNMAQGGPPLYAAPAPTPPPSEAKPKKSRGSGIFGLDSQEVQAPAGLFGQEELGVSELFGQAAEEDEVGSDEAEPIAESDGYPAQHPQAGHPQAGHPQAGHPQAGHPQAGHPQAGHPQAGQPGQPGQPGAYPYPYPQQGYYAPPQGYYPPPGGGAQPGQAPAPGQPPAGYPQYPQYPGYPPPQYPGYPPQYQGYPPQYPGYPPPGGQAPGQQPAGHQQPPGQQAPSSAENAPLELAPLDLAPSGAGFCLVALEGLQDGTRFDLPGGKVYLMGRDREADIKLLSTSVSRRQARIDATGDTPVLIDLGSANGTKVNSAVVDRHPLQEGDLIKMGQVVLRFQGSR